MIRVLHIFYEMSNGGIEHFVMNYYRHIDRSKIQFDFLVSVDGKGYFDDEITQLGGKIYHAYPLKKNPIKNYFSIAKIVKTYNYKIVHRHTGSAFGYFDLRAAKFGGAKKLILHSHNNQAGNNLLHHISKIILKTSCEELACSEKAGRWLFGKKSNFLIINNAIDFDKFIFNDYIRQDIRKKFNIDNKIVIGHVGRFETQKNHIFLINLLEYIVKSNPNCILMLVGSGSLHDHIKQIATEKGLSNNIIFLGDQSNAAIYYNAFDIFCLPSNYEGFGITLLEAQANGLNCITSKGVVPESVNVFGNITYLSLDENLSVWAETILKHTFRNFINSNEIKNSGFDIKSNAELLNSYYLNLDYYNL